MPTIHESFDPSAVIPIIDEEPEAVLFPVPFEDVEEDEEAVQEPLETSLESLDEGQGDEEEDDVLTLDYPVEDVDGDDEDNVLDNEDEEDEWR
jgi:hypothetical protein